MGDLVGTGSWGNLPFHGVEVRIYRMDNPEAPHYVVATYRLNKAGDDESHSAEVCYGPQEVLEALRNENGLIGSASKMAWENACDVDLDLAPERCERV